MKALSRLDRTSKLEPPEDSLGVRRAIQTAPAADLPRCSNHPVLIDRADTRRGRAASDHGNPEVGGLARRHIDLLSCGRLIGPIGHRHEVTFQLRAHGLLTRGHIGDSELSIAIGNRRERWSPACRLLRVLQEFR